MRAAEKLVLLAQDDKTVSLAVIRAAASSEAAAATFRLIVEQRYRCGDAKADDNEIDTMEDVTCRVPVGEPRAEIDTMEDVTCRVPVGEPRLRAAAAVDRAFQELVARLDHPTLRPEVAPAAREAAAHVRARYAEEDEGAQLGGVEFHLRVEFVDSFETDSQEETGRSDLELDEESWERGWSDGGDCRYVQEKDPAALVSDDEDGAAQFSARPYDGALAREGAPSDGTLLLSGFQARADGPELADQHDLTPRDVQRLVRLAVDGGDVEGDDSYRQALDGGAPVSRVTRAVMLDQALRSATARQQQPTSPRGMPARMRTGW